MSLIVAVRYFLRHSVHIIFCI